MSLFSIFKKKKEPVRFIAKEPLTWWIDDVECRVCALVDHPTLGLDKLPWPDCDKVYLAVDKTAYDKLEQENKMMRDEIKLYKECLDVCDGHHWRVSECIRFFKHKIESLSKLTKGEK
jgi:hypothetical protein